MYIPTEENVRYIYQTSLVKDKHMKFVKGLNLDYSAVSIDACTN